LTFAVRFWKKSNLAGYSILLLALGLVYAVTLAPGLTWAHDGADGGDLIAAAVSGGVAHPTGYPVYLILARLFLLLPFGSPAWRVNLFSAVSAAIAAVLVAEIVQRTYRGSSRIGLVGGQLAGFAFGVSPLLWSQAVVAEVYSLHACLIALGLWVLVLGLNEAPSQRWSIGVGVTLGVALGNHLTALFLVIPAVWIAWGDQPLGRWRRLWAAGLSLSLTLGLLYGVLLPWWASTKPVINWGNAATWSGWWWLVSAEPYRGLAFGAGAFGWLRLREVAGLWLAQFGFVNFLIGLAAFIMLDNQPGRLRLGLAWLFVICTVFAVGYNTGDSYNYLVPAFLAFAVELGLGLACLLEKAGQFHSGLLPVGLAVLISLIFWNAIPAMVLADASRDDRAETFIQTLAQAAPRQALLVTGEDRDSFASWYLHEALGERPDTVIIVERLWAFDWYHQELLARYPNLHLPPASDPNWRVGLEQLNNRPVCRTILDRPEVLDCGTP